ncbi:hypothetical protein [Caproicibacter fermentans]|uniref:Lipoprotein n=1 Tax=Caproicibacter fermentans TaxID=2576756 RepID=A0A7G8T7B8_9FIRM|nr:hypothetical protein [Caproicibacter fermentans]QNK39509.1 hypothetical protein HCR03_12220 [Caproicibacter fermentans]
MKATKFSAFCLSVFILTMAGCGTLNGGKAVSSGTGSAAENLSSESPSSGSSETSSAQSTVSQSLSGKSVSSKEDLSEKTSCFLLGASH